MANNELKHDYYIIESLSSEDIKDGKILRDVLRSLGGKYKPIHKKVNNVGAFESALMDFASSNCRYLFISAHGDQENIELADVSFNAEDLLEMDVNLNQSRIFMSTCSGGSLLWAKSFIRKGAYSVIGSPDKLDQIVAVGMWPTMISIFERLSEGNLKFSELNKALGHLVKVYEIKLSYFSFIRNEPNKMKEYIYCFNKKRERINHSI